MDEEKVDLFCGSKLWDHNLTWHTESPRLTYCFENSFLVYIPSFVFWAFVGLEVYFMLKSKAYYIQVNWRTIVKMVYIVMLIIICLLELALQSSKENQTFAIDIIAPIFQILTLISCLILVNAHRIFGQRSSGLMFLYWLLVILFEVPRVLSSIEKGINVLSACRIAYIFFSFLMFVLQWMVDLPPAVLDHPPIKNPSPEESAPFPSLITFSWFNQVISKGCKTTLTSCDLWSVDYHSMVHKMFARFFNLWNISVIEKNGLDFRHAVRYVRETDTVQIGGSKCEYKPSSISPIIWKSFMPAVIPCSIFMTLKILLSFASPLILKHLILFMEGNEPQWHGYFYASLLLVFSLLLMFVTSHHSKMSQITALRIKSVLMIAVYRQALKLSSCSRKISTLGGTLNLMAVDVQRSSQLVPTFIKLWAYPVQILLAITVLWQIFGISVLSGLGIFYIAFPLNAYLMKKEKIIKFKKIKLQDKRVKLMNEICSGIKMVKLYAWERYFQERILKIRRREDDLLKEASYQKTFIAFIWISVPFMMSLITFSIYLLVDKNNFLDTTKAFVSLALFNILRIPLSSCPNVINSVMQIGISLRRLDAFLNLKELDPNEVTYLDVDDPEEDALIMRNAIFSWNIKEQPTLRNITLYMRPGEFYTVVGTVGSGKSSLLSAFLGEMHKLSGEVRVKGTVAYVPQQPWIQNGTLQENILFGEEYENEKYYEVTNACSLWRELHSLPEGDQTEIGGKGIKLSREQKQRVSLARALYSNRDIYLLDNPLSAVDSDISRRIFNAAIGSRGLLRGKTRLFVTLNIDYLLQTDQIVVLTDGEIAEIGTYHQLVRIRGAFREYLRTYLTQLENENARDRSPINIAEPNQQNLQHSDLFLDPRSSLREEMKDERLINEEISEVGKVKWRVYTDYLKTIGLKMFSAILFFAILRQTFTIGSNLWLSEWSSDKSIFINGSYVISKRNTYMGFYGLFGFIECVSSLFFTMFWHIGAADAGTLLHYLFLVNILHSPVTFFETTPQGRIISRFAKDVDIVDNFLPSSGKLLITLLTGEIGTILLISHLTPIFLLAIIPIGIIYYFIQSYYIPTSRRLKRLESASKSPIYSHFSESFSGSSTIRAFGAQERFAKMNEEKVDFYQSCTYLNIIATRWLAIRLQFLANLIVFLCALLSVTGKGSLSPGLVALSITYALQSTQTLTTLTNTSAEVEDDIVAVERIKEYTELPQEADWDTPSRLVPDGWPQNGSIQFIDYKMRYRDDQDLALDEINLSIRGGEKIGIVGRTGAGKSSIALALFRIIEPAGGKIIIDDVDISKLGLHALRSHISIITQDTILFSGSLKSNIDPFDRYTEEQIWNVLELVNMKTYVHALKAGLEHNITEGGENMSYGQRQLICLCRLLLHKSKILVLDDATAAVDFETDEFLKRTIRTAFADCTVLTITNRISPILDSNRVIVLDEGSVFEFDNPTTLLEDRTTLFYRMAHEEGVA